MAYSNWGAIVTCNGIRREDKEDCGLFGDAQSFEDCYHGVMGDGDIRVACYKCLAPKIFEKFRDGAIKFQNSLQNGITFECGGYKFQFQSGDPCVAQMIEPNGNEWECTYRYKYGAGWE